jgi:Asp/Glu/hydantoin racemase
MTSEEIADLDATADRYLLDATRENSMREYAEASADALISIAHSLRAIREEKKNEAVVYCCHGDPGVCMPCIVNAIHDLGPVR